ncbi:EpsG family protein [Photobacterium leiognathi]|uniref:EpsG family protein n=1 Tax=Photobacterium leiognathi TaxID=553611 RepID=UPI00273A3137|nr:EpsG family protein [Photobacterium leiognathi]
MSTRSLAIVNSDDLIRYFDIFKQQNNEDWKSFFEQKNYFYYLIDRVLYMLSPLLGGVTMSVYLGFIAVILTAVKFIYIFRVFPNSYRVLGICWVSFSPLLLTLETQVIKQTLAIYILGLALSFSNKMMRRSLLLMSFLTHLGALFIYVLVLSVRFVLKRYNSVLSFVLLLLVPFLISNLIFEHFKGQFWILDQYTDMAFSFVEHAANEKSPIFSTVNFIIFSLCCFFFYLGLNVNKSLYLSSNAIFVFFFIDYRFFY